MPRKPRWFAYEADDAPPPVEIPMGDGVTLRSIAEGPAVPPIDTPDAGILPYAGLRACPKPEPRAKKPRKPLRSKGGRMFAETEDKPFSAYVRTFPCCFCLADGRAQTDATEVEHVVQKSHAGKDRGHTVPGCAYHRHLRHVVMGSRPFLKRYEALGLRAMALRLKAAYEKEHEPCP